MERIKKPIPVPALEAHAQFGVGEVKASILTTGADGYTGEHFITLQSHKTLKAKVKDGRVDMVMTDTGEVPYVSEAMIWAGIEMLLKHGQSITEVIGLVKGMFAEEWRAATGE